MNRAGEDGKSKQDYVLVTAAYNEESFIEKPLSSVVSQTLLPRKWIIVSDGSTDRTDEIVQAYAKKHRFIQLHRIEEKHPRNFTAQVNAINAGFALLRDLDYAFIGNLDADISLEPSYFARLLEKFQGDPRLGLAGGCICEDRGGRFQMRKANNMRSVAHAVQLFRHESFDALGGGYMPLPYGGPDWHAEVSLRMRGWRVQSFAELKAFHHRPTASAEGLLRGWYRLGLVDYSVGTHPLFEMFKVGRRLLNKPYVIGSLARLTGFLWGHCCRERRWVSREFMTFLRKDQLARLLFWRAEKLEVYLRPQAPPFGQSDVR